MNTLSEIAAVIKEHPAWVLVGHAIPDGDCIGSLLGSTGVCIPWGRG